MEPKLPLSRQAIDDFKAIYAEEFGHSISDDDAIEMGMRLLRLFRLLRISFAPV